MIDKINPLVALLGQDHATSTTPLADSSDVSFKRVVGLLVSLLHRVTACFHRDPVSSRTEDTPRHSYEEMLRTEDGFISARRIKSRGFLRIS